MSKFGGLFARKTGLYDGRPDEQTQAVDMTATAAQDPLGIDEELFIAHGALIGGENEQLRNLLLDASAKAGELDGLKTAVGRLIDPVNKALRAFEAEKSEKVALQTVLNNTRTAYGKLRNEVAELETRLATAERECATLRKNLSTAENAQRAAEAARNEIAVDLNARKAKIAELEARLAQESGEARLLREETRRQAERLATADKRLVTLESDLGAARQRLLMSDDEKRAQQSALEQITADSARLSRKLAECEAALNAAQGRLHQVEANVSEASAERARLTATLDETREQQERELATQRVRFEALQARASASEKLLVEAREHLIARAEEIREHDRRNSDIAAERDALAARLAELEAERIGRESQVREMEEVRAALVERGSSLTRAFAAKDAALARADETIASLGDRLAGMEAARASDRGTFEQAIEEITAALQREKMDRAVAEGALESARNDFARIMRELMALQRGANAADDPGSLLPANAA